MVLVSRRPDGLTLTRCPTCDGLRSIPKRRYRPIAQCAECKSGTVVLRNAFYEYWTLRFTHEEILEMARALFS